MRADETDNHSLEFILDVNDQPIAASTDIEYHAIVGYDARLPILLLDIVWVSLGCVLCFRIPCFQLRLRISTSLPELVQL